MDNFKNITTNIQCSVSHSSMVGLDGLPLRTPEDFKRHEIYCQSKIAMHQAMNDVLIPLHDRLEKELKDWKREKL